MISNNIEDEFKKRSSLVRTIQKEAQGKPPTAPKKQIFKYDTIHTQEENGDTHYVVVEKRRKIKIQLPIVHSPPPEPTDIPKRVPKELSEHPGLHEQLFRWIHSPPAVFLLHGLVGTGKTCVVNLFLEYYTLQYITFHSCDSFHTLITDVENRKKQADPIVFLLEDFEDLDTKDQKTAVQHLPRISNLHTLVITSETPSKQLRDVCQIVWKMEALSVAKQLLKISDHLPHFCKTQAMSLIQACNGDIRRLTNGIQELNKLNRPFDLGRCDTIFNNVFQACNTVLQEKNFSAAEHAFKSNPQQVSLLLRTNLPTVFKNNMEKLAVATEHFSDALFMQAHPSYSILQEAHWIQVASVHGSSTRSVLLKFPPTRKPTETLHFGNFLPNK